MDLIIRIRTLQGRSFQLGYNRHMEPLSREFLLNRGYCCGFGCMNCPYHGADTDIVVHSKQPEPGPRNKSNGPIDHNK